MARVHFGGRCSSLCHTWIGRKNDTSTIYCRHYCPRSCLMVARKKPRPNKWTFAFLRSRMFSGGVWGSCREYPTSSIDLCVRVCAACWHPIIYPRRHTSQCTRFGVHVWRPGLGWSTQQCTMHAYFFCAFLGHPRDFDAALFEFTHSYVVFSYFLYIFHFFFIFLRFARLIGGVVLI